MKVLQIDDKEKYWIDGADSVSTLEEAKELVSKNDYDVFLIDGCFPLGVGDEPDINAGIAAEFFSGRFPSAKMIIWANSIRAQKYAEDNGIICYSKKEMEEEHIEKMKKYGLLKYPEVRGKEDIL